MTGDVGTYTVGWIVTPHPNKKLLEAVILNNKDTENLTIWY